MKQLRTKLTRDSVARMLADAGVKPEHREVYRDYEIYIGDGFVLMPEIKLKRFGIEPGMFPRGCYCTMWFVAKGEDNFEIGSMVPFDFAHNPEWDPATKKLARVNRAVRLARDFINRRRAYASEGRHAHAS